MKYGGFPADRKGCADSMTYAQLAAGVAHLPLNQIAEVPKEKLIFSEEVRRMCERNDCGSYAKNWMCPPGVGPVAEWYAKSRRS